MEPYLVPIHIEHPEYFRKIFNKTDIKIVKSEHYKLITI